MTLSQLETAASYGRIRENLSVSDVADEAWIGTPVTGLQLGLVAELSLAAGFQPRLQ